MTGRLLLTAAQRVTAMTRARSACMHFAHAVRQEDAKAVQAITDGMERHELAALAIVLAAAADPVRLKVIKEAPDGERTQVA
jgi:hypothetical protein